MFQRRSPCRVLLGLMLAVSCSGIRAREAIAQADTRCATECAGNCPADAALALGRPRSAAAAAGIDAMPAPTPANAEYSRIGDCGPCVPADAARRQAITATFGLSVGNDQSLTVQRVAVMESAAGCAWYGVVQETDETALVMWSKDGHVSGALGNNGRVYTITDTGGNVHAVPERGLKRLPSDHAMPSAENSADVRRRDTGADVRSKSMGKRQAPTAATPPGVVPFSDAVRRALEAKQIGIDLMMLYTKRAASRYVIDLAQLVALEVAQTNQSFRNSGLQNISLRLVHTAMIDYDETRGGLFEHLYRMVDGVGPFKSVHGLRDAQRADIVGLIVDDASGCGQTTRIAPDPEEAYFVVHHSCAAVMMSIAHEIGHILGARHDPQTDGSNSPFAYGHGYVNGSKWRDIMSYRESCSGCRRIPYWSNPRVLYAGEPTGTDANDNARVILEQAERVSKFR